MTNLALRFGEAQSKANRTMATDTISPDSLNLTPAQAGQIIDTHYGERAISLVSLHSELSSVYRVELASGATLAFKAVRYSPELEQMTAWQTDVMEQLYAAGIPAGATRRTGQGELLARADTDQGRVIVHLGQWLSGTPLEQVPATPALMRAVGASGARIALALHNVPRPAIQRSHPWVLSRTLDSIGDALPLVRDPAIVALLQEASARFVSTVEPALATLPNAVVHHDLHDSNLLIDVQREDVNGVLDFGDMVWGPRIAELAVIAAYACRGAAAPVPAYLSVAEGWGQVMPLRADEVDVLFAASIGRLAVNLAVWSARSAGERGDYARARSQTTVHGLTALLDADAASVTEQLSQRLCGARVVR